MRVKFPANCKHPPYSHPYREVATVISGRIGFAAGDTFDTSKGDIGGAGSLGVVPANRSHFVWTENEEAGGRCRGQAAPLPRAAEPQPSLRSLLRKRVGAEPAPTGLGDKVKR
jgi:hypothetical protein